MSLLFSFFSSLYKNIETQQEDNKTIDKERKQNIENSHIHFINNIVEENKDKFIQESMILLEFIDKSFNTFKIINQRLDNLEQKIKILDKLEINLKKNDYTDSDSDNDISNVISNHHNSNKNFDDSNKKINNSNDNTEYIIDNNIPLSEQSVFI